MAGEAYTKRYVGGFVDLPQTTTAIDSQFLNLVESELLRLIGADPTDQYIQVWDAGLARFKTIQITDAQIAAAAAIAPSKIGGGYAPNKISASAFSGGPPASPSDGDIWLATDVAGNGDGTVWHFRYRSGSASAYKWEFIGGPPVRAAVSAFESTTTVTTWVDTATVGPSFTPSRGGDYHASYQADMNHSVANTKIQMGVGAAAFSSALDNFAIATPAGMFLSGSRIESSLSGWTGGTEIRCRYFNGAAGTLSNGNRTMLVWPTRVS